MFASGVNFVCGRATTALVGWGFKYQMALVVSATSPVILGVPTSLYYHVANVKQYLGKWDWVMILPLGVLGIFNPVSYVREAMAIIGGVCTAAIFSDFSTQELLRTV